MHVNACVSFSFHQFHVENLVSVIQFCFLLFRVVSLIWNILTQNLLENLYQVNL